MIDITALQKKATHPTTCIWVNASAGSGKTKVLTDRFVNLLLTGADPGKILCLTFTKAAAAEMALRIRGLLKKWSTLEDDALTQEIQSLSDIQITPPLLEKAKNLFSAVLSVPGGLKIMTIHSFCAFILKHFPLEANISPNFDVMDEQQAKTVLTQAILSTFQKSKFKYIIGKLALKANEESLYDLFNMLIQSRSNLLELKRNYKVEEALKKIKKNLKIDKYPSEDTLISTFCEPNKWLEESDKYLTKEGAIRKRLPKEPNAEARAEEAFNIAELLKNFQVFNQTKLLLTVAYEILQAYTQKKHYLGLMDYDDLILCTQNLLNETSMASWILYKLDNGLEHILLDEAQDTNPAQWRIISLLVEEFFAGEGRSDHIRTFFAVGDKKQSIYSFQGVNAEDFSHFKEVFKKKIEDAHIRFEEIPFSVSFRSTQAILDLVNKVFSLPEARQGVALPQEDILHTPFRQGAGGLVELWPAEAHQKNPPKTPWALPDFNKSFSLPGTKTARRIASRISEMLTNHEILESRGTPITPGDIMILVRRRSPFVEALIKALKDKNVPVAGIDKLNLTNHLVIQDLLALARFCLLPQDDFTLAAVLKSPIGGLSEKQLQDLCVERGTESLWDRLKSFYPDLYTLFTELQEKAFSLSPFDFFSYVLKALNIQEKFLTRFGTQVAEIIEEFLNVCLNFEENYTPSLSQFIYWISDKEISIKRDSDQTDAEQVRILTVHSSKGLQGNIVFLPDTCQELEKVPPLLWTKEGFPLWIAKKEQCSEDTLPYRDTFLQDRANESRRLLYVALTRARDRLYITGFNQKETQQTDSWYEFINEALKDIPADEYGIKRLVCPQKMSIHPHTPSLTDTKIPPQEIPTWAMTPAKIESPYLNHLAPSHAVHSDSDFTKPRKNDALEKGTCWHKLLQELPTISQEKWRLKAKEIAGDIPVPEEIFKLLEHPAIPGLFGPHSFAEVPIIGQVDHQIVSGQVDRLVFNGTEINLVDFKSDASVPKTLADAPKAYIEQLGYYKSLLQAAFPDKVIHAYIYWIRTLGIMEVK